MTTREAGDDGMPDDPEGNPSIPAVPDEVWLRFLTDSERAIRDSAPREPSARERATSTRPDAVPAWRDMEPGARLRRAGRVVAAAAAITLALGAWSWLSTSAGTPDAPLGETVQQSEQAPPATLPLTPTSTFASPSPSPAG